MPQPSWRSAVRAIPLILLSARAFAGPVIACPDGPDPLRFRAEIPIAPVSTAPDPVAIAASVDPLTGREWIAIAYLTPADAVAVVLSGDGGCSFGRASGGFDATVVAPGPVTSRPAIALRIDGASTLLAVSWREVDSILVRTSAVLDGSFGPSAALEVSARSAPRLAVSPSPSPLVLGVAWLADSAGSRIVRASLSTSPTDSTAWPAASSLNGSLGPDLGTGAEVALAADAAGAAGGAAFTLLCTAGAAGMVEIARADDVAAGFGAWRRVDDGSLVRPLAPALAAQLGSQAWTATSWSGSMVGAPATHLVAADAALEDNGSIVSDFDGAAAAPNPVEASPVGAGARSAVAVTGAVFSGAAFVAWEDAGEIHAVRRSLPWPQPHLAGGCDDFRLTGISPARGGGGAGGPVAASIADDLALAFVDDRSGGPEAWFKRSDSELPIIPDLNPAAAGCGPPPRVQLTWPTAPCDVAQLDVEVGTAPGGTDFTRSATGLASLLVEGLRPATQYYFRLRATDTSGNVGYSPERTATTAGCSNALLATAMLGVADTCAAGGAGSGDGFVDPGESVRIAVRVTNSGTDVATGANLRPQSRSPFLTVRTPMLALGDLAAGGTATAGVDVDVSATAPCGLPLNLLLRCDASGVAWADLVTLPAGSGCMPCRLAGCSVVANGSRSAPARICAGAQVTLDAGASGTGTCPGTLLYEWWDGTTMIGTAPQINRTPATPTTYRLVVRCSTDFDCMAETTVPIAVDALPPVTFTQSPPAPHCEGDIVTVTVSTSNPAATFTWDDGSRNATRVVSSAAALTCTVLDPTGCSRARNIRVDFGPVPPADAGPDIVGCGAVLVGSPGFPTLSYRWDPPAGLSSPWVAQPRASPATPTTYTLTVTDPTTGCYSTDTVNVQVSAGPGPVQDLRLARRGSSIDFSWTEPGGSLDTRIYSDLSARLAASANAASPSARRDGEGVGSCSAPLTIEPLVFFQAVSVCPDGVNEGPN